MVFSSLEFIFGFLPILLCLFYLFSLAKNHRNGALWLLFTASLFFYAAWDWRFLPLLIASIIFNYAAGMILRKYKNKYLLLLFVSFNLIALALFKYIPTGWVLPLGISFYTFQQIGYIVDCYRKTKLVSYSLIEYATFIAFFPQLIAGPIVLHEEFIPQIRSEGWRQYLSTAASHFAKGLFVFSVGLAMKVMIADKLASMVNTNFDNANSSMSFVQSLIGSLGFTGQIFYDFAGYSLMAIGLAAMLGLNLPDNFNKPYLAVSVRDFWRRWHITLGRFFREYLYIPLGGNRKGELLTYRNILITFMLTGIWHGAGVLFFIWGLVHGLAIVFEDFINKRSKKALLSKPFQIVLTFIFINLTWIIFRAESLTQLKNMFLGFINLNSFPEILNLQVYLSSSELLLLVFSLILSLYIPKAESLLKNFRPSWLYLVITFGLIILSVINIFNNNTLNEFIYFEF